MAVLLDTGIPWEEIFDLEAVALSTDPEFMKLIQSSRERQAREGGLSGEEIRRRLEAELRD